MCDELMGISRDESRINRQRCDSFVRFTMLHFKELTSPTWLRCLFWIPGGLITSNVNVTLQLQFYYTDGETHPHCDKMLTDTFNSQPAETK